MAIHITHTELTGGRHSEVYLDYVAHGRPVIINRDGVPIAVLISTEAFEAIRVLVEAMYPDDCTPDPPGPDVVPGSD